MEGRPLEFQCGWCVSCGGALGQSQDGVGRNSLGSCKPCFRSRPLLPSPSLQISPLFHTYLFLKLYKLEPLWKYQPSTVGILFKELITATFKCWYFVIVLSRFDSCANVLCSGWSSKKSTCLKSRSVCFSCSCSVSVVRAKLGGSKCSSENRTPEKNLVYIPFP